MTGKDVFPEKVLIVEAVATKRLEDFPLDKGFEKQTKVIKEKEEKINKHLKRIIATDENFFEQVGNIFVSLRKQQVE